MYHPHTRGLGTLGTELSGPRWLDTGGGKPTCFTRMFQQLASYPQTINWEAKGRRAVSFGWRGWSVYILPAWYRSWARGCLVPQSKVTSLLTFRTWHSTRTGHTVGLKQVPGASKLQHRAAGSGAPGRNPTWGCSRALMGVASLGKSSGIFRTP